MEIHTGSLGHQPVGNTGRKGSCQECVGPTDPPTGNKVVTFIDLLQKFGNFRGIVLKITVHGNDKFPERMIETGHECRSLTIVAAEVYHDDTGVLSMQEIEDPWRAICAAIVDQHQFPAYIPAFHGAPDRMVEIGKGVCFIVQRNDHGNPGTLIDLGGASAPPACL